MADLKQTFTPKFRAAAVRLAQTSGRSRREVAADFGVGDSTLRYRIDGRHEWEVNYPPVDRQKDTLAIQWRQSAIPEVAVCSRSASEQVRRESTQPASDPTWTYARFLEHSESRHTWWLHKLGCG